MYFPDHLMDLVCIGMMLDIGPKFYSAMSYQELCCLISVCGMGHVSVSIIFCIAICFSSFSAISAFPPYENTPIQIF